MNNNFTDEEKRILALAADDDKKIIAAYVEGQEFTIELIQSLNLEQSKESCRDYNNNVRHFMYHQSHIRSFTEYIQTIKSWYPEE